MFFIDLSSSDDSFQLAADYFLFPDHTVRLQAVKGISLKLVVNFIADECSL
jgi:hypothetical protein